jgi:aspartokinase/homoserine dehydrogenase 1
MSDATHPVAVHIPTLVMKFGGTSVGSPAALGQCVQIIQGARAEWPRLVVVASALSGVTNQLLESAQRAACGDVGALPQSVARLREAHANIAQALISGAAARNSILQEIDDLLATFDNLCRAMAVLGESTPRALDMLAALGERMSVRLLAGALVSAGLPAQAVEATRLIITDDHYQDAHPQMPSTIQATRAVLEPLLAQGVVPVVTGFIAATPQGQTTTLGRGGSDYSAALLGAALPAQDVWIWTDVDGVMTTDPRLVPAACTIPILTYREISELAYFGAKVVHPKTILPVVEAGIGLRVCNTFNPDHPGTRLVADNGSRGSGAIKAVTAIRGQQLITVEGRGMLGVPGVAARAFGAVASTGTSVPLITQASSEQSICFAVPSKATAGVLAALQRAFAGELANRDIERIWATEETVIVTAVGAGMQHTPGVAGRIFSALGQAGVNVIAIAQGSSEVSISLVVEAADVGAAVNAIHDLIR